MYNRYKLQKEKTKEKKRKNNNYKSLLFFSG